MGLSTVITRARGPLARWAASRSRSVGSSAPVSAPSPAAAAWAASGQRGLLQFELEAKKLSKQDVLKMRKEHWGSSMSVSYSNSEPLLFTSAYGAHMVDVDGTEYLDTRNNVPHLGHCHPDVVAAVQRQVAAVNTNTRYLHPNQALVAKELLKTFPEELSVCFLVNSGTEANDLAMRLAQAHTRSRNVISVDDAYHGHSSSVIAISPYKRETLHVYEPWVYKVPSPDTYRGPFRESDAGEQYATAIQKAILKAGGPGHVGAFFIESGLAVGGAVVLPKGYLKAAYAYVRDAGGVCVADEVQVGFGRVGTHFWAFEQQEVVPDIVTVGKPFGNGMPIAAVVTTPAISESFTKTGIEYFNTYGGNPVCSAAGLAVLEVIQRDNLQQHALEIGAYMRQRFLEVADKYPLIGDVRGTGLFMGVEFVRNRDTREAATKETSIITSRLKNQHHILTSVDGPHDNVLIIKPPMCFTRDNVDTFVDAVAHVLGTLEVDTGKEQSRTPT